MADVMERCDKAGFTSYIAKPVDFAKLSDALRKVLDGKKEQLSRT
jgi:hypothetical protein